MDLQSKSIDHPTRGGTQCGDQVQNRGFLYMPKGHDDGLGFGVLGSASRGAMSTLSDPGILAARCLSSSLSRNICGPSGIADSSIGNLVCLSRRSWKTHSRCYTPYRHSSLLQTCPCLFHPSTHPSIHPCTSQSYPWAIYICQGDVRQSGLRVKTPGTVLCITKQVASFLLRPSVPSAQGPRNAGTTTGLCRWLNRIINSGPATEKLFADDKYCSMQVNITGAASS